MYLFFDTETTGFPPGAPHVHLVQLAWILCDDQGEERASADLIVKPDGWTIPDEAAAIHRISQAHANTFGAPVGFALSLFMAGSYLAHTFVGHNLEFDKGIMATEFERIGWENPITDDKKMLCTMKTQAVVDHCKLFNKNGRPKWPKLTELHTKLFGYGFEEAHNALADIRATARCFWRLRSVGLI